MSTFSERLEQLLNKKGMTQAELAELTGIRASSISDYMNDRYLPKQDKVHSIARALNVSPSYLIGFGDNGGLNHIIKDTLANMFRMNSYGQNKVLDYSSLLVKTGDFLSGHCDEAEVLVDNLDQYKFVDSEYRLSTGFDHCNSQYQDANRHIIKVQDEPNHDLVIEVNDDSMSPLIIEGDIAYIRYTNDYIDGKIYAVQVENELFIKYCYFDKEKQKLTLVAENPEYDDVVLYLNSDSNIKLIGIIAGWVTP